MPSSVNVFRLPLVLPLIALLGVVGCAQHEQATDEIRATVSPERDGPTSGSVELQTEAAVATEAKSDVVVTAERTETSEDVVQNRNPQPGAQATHAHDLASVSKIEGATTVELVVALSGEDAVARFLAEEQLVELGDEAVAALKSLATSSGFTTGRHYAIIVLARIASEDAIAVLLEILEQEPDVRLRALVCTHLGRLGVEEAVPIIGKWLLTIEGKSLPGWYPGVSKPTLFWLEHVYALRAIGSERAIPILEKMRKTRHGGQGGNTLRTAYQECLVELDRQDKFWQAVSRVPGLEPDVQLLFDFFRKDTLASIRLYRDKIVHGGLEGQWVLEDMQKHPDEKLQKAAATLLSHYGNLDRPREGEQE